MPVVRLELLGGFQLSDVDGAPVAVPSRKARAVLACVALSRGRPQTRDRLAALCWPDSNTEQARTSLRQALAALRRALGVAQAVIQCEADTVTLGQVAVDVAEFELAIDAGSGADVEATERAVALYRGDLLEDVHAGAPSIDQWLAVERERLRGLASDALTRLLWHYEQSGQFDKATACATRLLAFDALQESVHRTLMRLYDHQGRQALALRQYRQCCEALERELGVRPEADTENLYQAILARRAASGENPPAPMHDAAEATTAAHLDPARTGSSPLSSASAPETRLATGNGHPLSPGNEGRANRLDHPRQAHPERPERPEAPEHAEQGQAPGKPGPELRHAVVLMASLDETMAGAAERDPEHFYARLLRWREAVTALAARYDGRVTDAIGGRVTLVFGVPMAHGNDAERALHLGLALHALADDCIGAETDGETAGDTSASRARAGDTARRAACMRVGVASGQVVAVTEAGGIALAGVPLTVAMQAMEHAAPGSTVVSNRVFLALPGRLDAASVGQVPVAGVVEPIRLWHVRRMLEIEEMLPQHAFVGRRAELSQLAGVADDCLRSGHGRVVVIRGDAGIGKSRLAERFIALAREHGMEAHRVLVLDFGVAGGSEPLRVLVRSLLAIPTHADASMRAAAVAGAYAAGQLAAEDVPFANDMLELPQPSVFADTLAAMDNATRERCVQRVLAELVRQRASLRPLLVVVEDVHWADRAWLDCLARLAMVTRQCPLTLTLTVRPEQDPLDGGWRAAIGGASLTTIDLGPLSEEEAQELAACHPRVGTSLARSCIRRAEGNPLFLDQLLRGVRTVPEDDSGHDSVSGFPGLHAVDAQPMPAVVRQGLQTEMQDGAQDHLPDSLQSIVLARLDRLPAADRIALQAAATLGQRFTPAALCALINDPTYPCDNLVRHAMVRPEGEDYLFMHALIHEAVYASLLRSRRIALHRRAAAWYAERDLALHAGHLDAAEEPGAAAAYELAARKEAAHFRNAQARRLVERALRIVAAPDALHSLCCLHGTLALDLGEPAASLASYRRAVALAKDNAQRACAWIGVASALRLLDRYTEALDALTQAGAAASERDDPDLLAQIASLRGNVQFPMGNLDECLAAHQQALHHGRAAGSALAEARALGGLGDAYYQQGRMLTAGAHFMRCVALARERGFLRIEGSNLPMVGVVDLFCNQLDTATGRCEDALRIARRIGDARIEIISLDVAASVARCRAAWDQVAEQASQALSVARRLGARRFEAELLARLGLALGMQGERAQGEHLLDEALRLSRACGVRYAGPTVLGFLARVSTDPARRLRALQDGQAILAQGCVSHCHLDLYEAAIDVSVEAGRWDDVATYVQLLRDYIAPEPFPWATFLLRRGDALAAAGRAVVAAGATPGVPLARPDLKATLTALRDEAIAAGLEHARQSIEPWLTRLR